MERRAHLAANFIADLAWRDASGMPSDIVELDGKAMFAATSADTGRELYVAEADGLRLVRDLNPGRGSSSPDYLTPFDGRVYFFAADATGTARLWSSDGTYEGTRAVEPAQSGTTYGSRITEAGGSLYFITGTSPTGTLMRLAPGGGAPVAVATGIETIAGVGGTSAAPKLFVSGTGVFKSVDCTTGGVVALTTQSITSFRTECRVADGRLFVAALKMSSSGDYVVTHYASDGAAPLTEIATLIGSGFETDDYTADFTAVGGVVYFVGEHAPGATSLYRTDGTAAGTSRINATLPRYITSLHAHQGRLYFTAPEGGIYRSDGTPVGTTRVDVTGDYIYVTRFHSSGDALLASVEASSSPTSVESRLVRVDTSTGVVATLARVSVDASRYQNTFATVGDVVYFGARDDSTGVELWQTNGTAAGTSLVDDLFTGGTQYFGGTAGTSSQMLVHADSRNERWRISDGTSAGTRDVTALMPSGRRTVRDLIVVGTGFYAALETVWPSTAVDVYACNTVDPATLILTLERGANLYGEVNGKLIYLAPSNGSGTVSVFALDPVTNASTLLFSSPAADWQSRVARRDKSIAFGLQAPGQPKRLIVSDGTPAGTRDVVAPDGAALSVDFATIVEAGTSLYFFDQPVGGARLYRIAAGSSVAERITAPGLTSPDPYGGAWADGESLYFVGWTNSSRALWKTDGTSAGTQRVEIAGQPGPIGASYVMGGGGGLLYFADEVAATGRVRRYDLSAGSASTVVPSAPQSVSRGQHLVSPDGALLVSIAQGPSTRTFYEVAPTSTTPVAIFSSTSTRLLSFAAGTFFIASDGLRGGGLWRAFGEQTPYTPRAPVLQDSSDTGSSRADRVTSDVTPDIFGIASPGTTVNVYVDGALVTSTLASPTSDYRVTLPTLAQGVRRVRVTSSQPGGATSALSDELVLQVDSVAPTVVSTRYDVDAGQRLVVLLDEPDVQLVGATLRPLAGGADLPLRVSRAGESIFVEPTTLPLPDGRYRYAIPVASLVDRAGNVSVSAAISVDFVHLAGDATGDAVVNFYDLLVLAANYNGVGRTFTQGDFDFDGVVDFDDLLMLAARYNTSRPAATPAPGFGTGWDADDADDGDRSDATSGVVL